jgi:hypothetical protein
MRVKMIAAALCFFLLLCDAVMGSQNDFLGQWTNRDPNTNGITKVVIRDVRGQVMVRAWGACTPDPCDWGETTMRGTGAVRYATWNPGFAIESQTFRLFDGIDGLRIETHTHFTDNSGRPDYDQVDLMNRVGNL